MRARLIVHITPDDVGSRVSVRSRISAAPGEPSTTDTVGRLLAWEGGYLRIERRDGRVADIAGADLLAGKVLPDPPPRAKPG